MSSLDELLRRHRSEAGLTQEELAEQAGVSTRAVSDIERGLRSTIYRDTAGRLATALGLSDDDRAGFEAAARGRGGPAEPRRAGLPAQLTPIIGRARELDAVVSALRKPELRLLTLTGPGGIGKTRLAVEAAGLAREDFDGGVFFVPLAATQDPDLLLPVVARALGIGAPGGSLLAAVAAGLGARRCLLVLDTFEHLLDAAAVVGDLLGACPGLTVMATTREALHVRGEREVAVPPLELPEDPAGSSPATELFLERAEAVKPDLVLDKTAATIVGEICRRLNGLPLAIELAAARAKHLPLAALRDQLEHRLNVLTGGPRDLPARQQTMRDTVAWTYELLDPVEQSLFRDLSAFAGGWTLDAAAAVCAGEGDVLDPMSALVDKSAVYLVDASDTPRYGMLDVIREYAAEQHAIHEDAAETARRHAKYFAALAEAAEPRLGGADQAEAFRLLDTELENLRSALRWSIEGDEADLALRMAGALWQYWRPRGDFAEGRAWLHRALSLQTALDVVAREKALWGAAWLAYHQGDYDEARVRGDALLESSKWSGERIARRNGLTMHGMVALARGHAVDAVAPLEECVEICRAEGPPWLLATSLMNLGLACLHAGSLVRAKKLLGEARSRYQELGDEHFAARALTEVAYAALLEGNAKRARSLFATSLEAFRDLGDKGGIAEGLEGMATAAAAAGAPEAAARLAGAAEALRETIATLPHGFNRSINERYLAIARGALDDARWRFAWEDGRGLPVDDAIEEALKS